MNGVTKGGITNKVLTGRTAPALQRYPDSKDEDTEPYLYSAARHCSHDTETQIAEWKAVREEHGTQGAVRTTKAVFESVDTMTGFHDSGKLGTHVREHSGGRWRKRPVRDGETPTHFRIDAGGLTVRESEAVHTIYAAGEDLLNRENPEDLEGFFNAVVAERNANYAGLQEFIWLERNGKSGLVHVHVASNATVFEDFESNGVQYKAGQKMAGDLTRVHAVRDRFNKFLEAHPEHGFEQALAPVGSPEYFEAQQKSGQRDYWHQQRAERGEAAQESNHAKARRISFETLSLDAVDGSSRDIYESEIKAMGVAVKQVGLRRGKATKGRDYSYRVEGTKNWVKGSTLGAEYTYEGIGSQLQRKADGLPLQLPAPKQNTGDAKPLSLTQNPLDAEQRAELRMLISDVNDQARAEAELQLAVQTQAVAQVPVNNVSFDELLAEAHAAVVETDTSWLDKLHPSRKRRKVEAQPDVTEVQPEPDVETAEAIAADPLVIAEAEVAEELTALTPVAPDPVVMPEISAIAQPRQSLLRFVQRPNERKQAIVEAMADFEENHAWGALVRGEHLDEKLVPTGVGRAWLAEFSDHLAPAVSEQLWLRVQLIEQHDAEYKVGRDALESRKELEQEAGFGGNHAQQIKSLGKQVRVSNLRRQWLKSKRAAGDYDINGEDRAAYLKTVIAENAAQLRDTHPRADQQVTA